MELFITILLVVAVVSGGIFIWTEIGITNDRLRWLEERLTKLEKDAVKVTFTGKPNPKQFDGVKSEEPFTKTRKKNKTK